MSVVRPMHTSNTGVVVLCHQPVFSVSAWGLRFLTLKIQQFPRNCSGLFRQSEFEVPFSGPSEPSVSLSSLASPVNSLHLFSMATSSFSVAPSVVSGFCLGNLVFCLGLVLGHPMVAKDWAEASSPYLGRDLCGR